jgi:hypothetical protein
MIYGYGYGLFFKLKFHFFINQIKKLDQIVHLQSREIPSFIQFNPTGRELGGDG